MKSTDTSPFHGERISASLYRVAWWGMAGPDVVDCDVFAVDCGEQVVLIDSGRGGASFSMLQANLRHWGLWGRLSTCLLTHLHFDHSGGADQLQAGGVRVWGSEGAAAYLGDRRAGADPDMIIPRLDRVLADGETIALGNVSFEVLATPGHTGACASYLATIDGLRCAFTGDLLMPRGTIGYSGSFDFDAQRLQGSLRRLLERDFDALFTGHMLAASQPEGFWRKDGKKHAAETLQAGLEGRWVIET